MRFRYGTFSQYPRDKRAPESISDQFRLLNAQSRSQASLKLATSKKPTFGQLRSIHERQLCDANATILASLSGYSTGTATDEGSYLQI